MDKKRAQQRIMVALDGDTLAYMSQFKKVTGISVNEFVRVAVECGRLEAEEQLSRRPEVAEYLERGKRAREQEQTIEKRLTAMMENAAPKPDPKEPEGSS